MSTTVLQAECSEKWEGSTRTSYFDDGSRMRFIILTENTFRLETVRPDGSIAWGLDISEAARPIDQ